MEKGKDRLTLIFYSVELVNNSSLHFLPAKIGTKDSNAGEIQVFNIMNATFRLVMFMGYFKGFTIA